MDTDRRSVTLETSACELRADTLHRQGHTIQLSHSSAITVVMVHNTNVKTARHCISDEYAPSGTPGVLTVVGLVVLYARFITVIPVLIGG